jgi:hypothetical protein
MEENKKLYNSPLAIKAYYHRTGITAGEISILNYLVRNKKDIKMLDIGIGCGRTYERFSESVIEYTGIDYSEAMIKACKNKFEYAKNCFYVSDARNLSNWQDNSFDFILFSFNGIDFVDENDRKQIYCEIKRTTVNHALFAFSSHNLYNLPKLFKFKIPKNPLNYLPEYKRYHFIAKSNPSLKELLEKNIAIIKDGDLYNEETSYCYIKPEYQINQLRDLGINVIGVFSDYSDREYPLTTNWKNIDEPWYYFLCQIIK